MLFTKPPSAELEDYTPNLLNERDDRSRRPMSGLKLQIESGTCEEHSLPFDERDEIDVILMAPIITISSCRVKNKLKNSFVNKERSM